MQEYILNYLSELETSLNGRVNSQFIQLKGSIHNIDKHLSQLENELDE